MSSAPSEAGTGIVVSAPRNPAPAPDAFSLPLGEPTTSIGPEAEAATAFEDGGRRAAGFAAWRTSTVGTGSGAKRIGAGGRDDGVDVGVDVGNDGDGVVGFEAALADVATGAVGVDGEERSREETNAKATIAAATVPLAASPTAARRRRNRT